jgi:hypothetical protein
MHVCGPPWSPRWDRQNDVTSLPHFLQSRRSEKTRCNKNVGGVLSLDACDAQLLQSNISGRWWWSPDKHALPQDWSRKQFSLLGCVHPRTLCPSSYQSSVFRTSRPLQDHEEIQGRRSGDRSKADRCRGMNERMGSPAITPLFKSP